MANSIINTSNAKCRDIVEISWTQRYIYDSRSIRISVEFDYAEDIRRGETGSNFASGIARNIIDKVWYRSNHLCSSVIIVKNDSRVISHMTYDL